MVALAFIGLVATSCGNQNSETGQPTATVSQKNDNVNESTETATAGGRLVYGLIAETNGWNPSASQWATSGTQVARTIYDTLAAYDENSQIQPFLAEKFTPNATYDEWVITLRPNVKFHNGKTLTADDVRRNQEFLKRSPLTSSPYETIESFSTRGELDVVVKMKDPWVNYPYSLATQIGVVVDPDWMEDKASDPQKPIGTGPFKVDTWVPDKSMLVRKNASYWQKGYPLLDEVEYRPIPDDTSRSNSLRSGELDVIEASNAQEIKKFKGDADTGNFQVFNAVQGESAEVFVMINTLQPPLDTIEGRQALAYATDADYYNATLNGGLFEVAKGPFSPSSPWYTATDYPSPDANKARDLVEKVKTNNGGQFKIALVGPPTPGVQEGMQLLEQQWEAVGIDVEISTTDQLSMIVKVISGKYQAAIWQQFDSPNPLGDSVWWHPRSAFPLDSDKTSLNFARSKDDEIGKALDLARQTTDPAVEKEQYRIVQQRMNANLPYIWLYHAQVAVVADKTLVNVTKFNLPNGTRGLGVQSGVHPVWQIWRKA